jgi:hypothetical protein
MSSIASRGPHSSQMMRARRSYSKAANLWASERAVLSRQLFSLEGTIDQSASQSRRVRSRRIFKGVTRGRLQGGSRAFRCKNTDVKRPRGWPPARSARGRVRFEKAASAMRFPCLLGLRAAGATGGMPMYATSFNPTYTSVDVYINHQSTASAPSPAHRTCTESHPLLPSHPSTGLRDARHHILPQSAGGSATWQHGQTHAHAVISRRALCTVPGRDRMPRCSMSRRSSQS